MSYFHIFSKIINTMYKINFEDCFVSYIGRSMIGIGICKGEAFVYFVVVLVLGGIEYNFGEKNVIRN